MGLLTSLTNSGSNSSEGSDGLRVGGVDCLAASAHLWRTSAPICRPDSRASPVPGPLPGRGLQRLMDPEREGRVQMDGRDEKGIWTPVEGEGPPWSEG